MAKKTSAKKEGVLSQLSYWLNILWHESPSYICISLLSIPLAVGISLLSAADGSVASFVRRTFGTPVVLHPLAPLCEYFYRKSRVGNFAKVYAQLYDGYMEVVCFDKKGLLLANTFATPATDDAAYHLLNVWQQLGLNQQTDEVQIAGDAVARRELATLLRRYIRTVGPVIFPSQRHTIGSDAMQLPFDLTALSLCEL